MTVLLYIEQDEGRSWSPDTRMNVLVLRPALDSFREQEFQDQWLCLLEVESAIWSGTRGRADALSHRRS